VYLIVVTNIYFIPITYLSLNVNYKNVRFIKTILEGCRNIVYLVFDEGSICPGLPYYWKTPQKHLATNLQSGIGNISYYR